MERAALHPEFIEPVRRYEPNRLIGTGDGDREQRRKFLANLCAYRDPVLPEGLP